MGPLLKKIRALLGPTALLYTNECESSFVNHTGPSLDKLPPELDLISFDACESRVSSRVCTARTHSTCFHSAACFRRGTQQALERER